MADTNEYVTALRTSTDRARYSLYVVVVATVLVFIAAWNISDAGWPRKRLDAWYKYARGTPAAPAPPANIARGDAERLKELRTEYVKQFATRSIFTASPIPGVSIDINDLGVFGGVTLVLLMIVLAASIAREHENLYLALYKVRLIWQESPTEQSKGGSEANLLYHALAMTQVLNSPPTLARWRKPRPLQAFRVVFLLPAAVYAWVVWTEWDTRQVSLAYGVDVVPTIWGEIVGVAILLFLGVLAWLHSNAMADRWDRAFFCVNPGRKLAPQMSVWEWLRVGPGKKTEPYLRQQRLASAIIDRLERKPVLSSAYAPIEPIAVKFARDRITRADLHRLRGELLKQGIAEASKLCRAEKRNFVELEAFTVSESVVREQSWTVAGTWKYGFTTPVWGSNNKTA